MKGKIDDKSDEYNILNARNEMRIHNKTQYVKEN